MNLRHEPKLGLRRQSAAATALPGARCKPKQRNRRAGESGVALRFPPQSKNCFCAIRNLMNKIWQNDSVIAHTQMLARSFQHWTKDDLLPGLFNPLVCQKTFFTRRLCWSRMARKPTRF